MNDNSSDQRKVSTGGFGSSGNIISQNVTFQIYKLSIHQNLKATGIKIMLPICYQDTIIEFNISGFGNSENKKNYASDKNTAGFGSSNSAFGNSGLFRYGI